MFTPYFDLKPLQGSQYGCIGPLEVLAVNVQGVWPMSATCLICQPCQQGHQEERLRASRIFPLIHCPAPFLMGAVPSSAVSQVHLQRHQEVEHLFVEWHHEHLPASNRAASIRCRGRQILVLAPI